LLIDPLEMQVSVWAIYTACFLLVCLSVFVIALVWHSRRLNADCLEKDEAIHTVRNLDLETGIPNQQAFLSQLDLKRGQSNGTGTTALFVIGCSSPVNSVHEGVCQADHFLSAVSPILLPLLLRWDNAPLIARGRTGCFLCLLHLHPNHQIGSVSEDILSEIKDYVGMKYEDNMLRPAIGIALCEQDVGDPSELISRAQLAFEEAIDVRHEDYSVFHPSLVTPQIRRETIAKNIGHAVEHKLIRPHYQPCFDARSGPVFGLEAFARWHHPKLGWITPPEFLPCVRTSMLLADLDISIMDQACADMCRLSQQVPVTINLSKETLLNDDLALIVERTLSVYGLKPQRLAFDIGEGAIEAAGRRSIQTLRGLQGLGTKLCLDGFGWGGARSFRNLSVIDWDMVKFDPELISQALEDMPTRTLVNGLMQATSDIGVTPLAKNVETAEQRDFLLEVGVFHAQGFLYCGPLAFEELVKIFDELDALGGVAALA